MREEAGSPAHALRHVFSFCFAYLKGTTVLNYILRKVFAALLVLIITRHVKQYLDDWTKRS